MICAVLRSESEFCELFFSLVLMFSSMDTHTPLPVDKLLLPSDDQVSSVQSSTVDKNLIIIF